ncbi:MAG: methyltransferase, partial [Cytophagales bacterium]|nr:methyltransferase [Cytophagales bacterium]
MVQSLSQGRDVLNTFCYTGGFSVYALAGGARTVHSVDSSEKAMRLTQQNIELNLGPDSRHQSHTTDVSNFLSAAGQDFDLIILDPPAFA